MKFGGFYRLYMKIWGYDGASNQVNGWVWG